MVTAPWSTNTPTKIQLNMDSQANSTTRATVLFVDDEERVVNLLRMIFRTQYDVLVATSGAQALQIIKERRVDVLVTDQRMPGMTGIELLTQARECSPHTIRLLLTGYTDLAAIVGSVNEGEVFRFLNKPGITTRSSPRWPLPWLRHAARPKPLRPACKRPMRQRPRRAPAVKAELAVRASPPPKRTSC